MAGECGYEVYHMQRRCYALGRVGSFTVYERRTNSFTVLGDDAPKLCKLARDEGNESCLIMGGAFNQPLDVLKIASKHMLSLEGVGSDTSSQSG